MIIFIDGINGTGKTTYAKELSRRLGWKYYRSFRKGKDKHSKSLEGFLELYGCPVNSHIDDIYFADLFSNIELDIVMERSFVSALAYDSVYDSVRKKQSAAAFRYWLKQLRGFEHLYVWLESDYITAKSRQTGFQPKKKEFKKLVSIYEKAFHKMPKTKMRIQTDLVSIEDGVNRVCHHVKNR